MNARLRNVDQCDEYRRLVRTNDCTPEQQAGEHAKVCAKCETWTVHQHLKNCIVCGWKEPKQ